MFLRFCLCFFESETVKTDCPVQIFRKMLKYLKIYYRLLFYLTCFTVFLEILKKSSENDQLTGHFSELFYFIFFRPHDPKSEKNSRKSTNKKIWPNASK